MNAQTEVSNENAKSPEVAEASCEVRIRTVLGLVFPSTWTVGEPPMFRRHLLPDPTLRLITSLDTNGDLRRRPSGPTRELSSNCHFVVKRDFLCHTPSTICMSQCEQG
jgi:hypothetical protein